MPFKRTWDSSCPQIYDEWESDGASWVIQDLPPEDDEEALNLLVEHLMTDEFLCKFYGVYEDPISKQYLTEYWRQSLTQRMSLACYQLKEGKKTMAAMNCCYVKFAEDKKKKIEAEGEACRKLFKVFEYIENNHDAYNYLGTDKLLYALGLVVRRDFRGAKLGARVLAAREPLCKSQGIPATGTMFSIAASQKSAARAGFSELRNFPMKELADAGFQCPSDGCIKYMVKKYTP